MACGAIRKMHTCAVQFAGKASVRYPQGMRHLVAIGSHAEKEVIQ
jgi:hypothetical protein